MPKKLDVVSVETSKLKPATARVSQTNRRDETRAKFERLWLTHPEQFDPNRDSMERERLKRTWDLMQKKLSFQGKEAVELGCGYGELSQRLAEQGAIVTAVDIAQNALKKVQAKNIAHLKTFQDYVPHTKLKDDSYDLIVCTELIGYLKPEQYRLFFSELARLVRAQGFVVCSSAIDIHSDDALQRFISLAETEFEVDTWIFSYHALYIRIVKWLSLPDSYMKAYNDPEYHRIEVECRKGIARALFRLNSSFFVAHLWSGIKWMLSPLTNYVRQNHNFLVKVEKICRFFWDESGISHALFLGIRRSIAETTTEGIPVERKYRKEIWE